MRNKKLEIIVVFLFLLILGVGLYFYFRKTSSQANYTQSSTLQYKNVERGFTLDYPKELALKDFDEGDTTHTLVFSEIDGDKTFQVFFTPYFGTQITQSRILKDVATGKFTTPVEIVLGGGSIHALAFFSTDDYGELREVWFLHEGYLFEVTAYKDLDEWLSGIMQSWRFVQGNSAGGQ